MKKLANVHPGEILYCEFLEPLEISAYGLSEEEKTIKKDELNGIEPLIF